MASSINDTGEAYYLRTHLLIAKQATYVLRCTFDRFYPPDELHAKLQTKKNMDRVNYGKKNNKISHKQYSLLFPSNGKPESKNFDISLLMFLLKNICQLHKSKWWKVEDNSQIPEANTDVEADIVRLRNLRNKLYHTANASLDEQQFVSDWELAEKAMVRLTEQCGIHDIKQKIDEVKTSRLDVISEELRSIRGNTTLFLEQYDDKGLFVETDAYRKALQMLKENNAVVLTGHPGEGKTTMAARLALKTTEAKNCLMLNQPSDWRHVDLTLKLFKVVIIDDIFGAGSLDQKMVGNWRDFLPEISLAAKRKQIKVIITSRHSIFEESKEERGSIPILDGDDETEKKDSVVLLTSSDLSNQEKIDIFKSQATRNNKEIPVALMNECVFASTDEPDDVMFGFPECVSMFVRNNRIYDKGSEFFKTPAALFKKYLEDLYKSRPRDKFLALVIVWSKENRMLSDEEIKRVKTASEQVKQVAEVFDRDVDSDFLETVKLSLDSHVGGFLKYDDRTGHYAFNHNIIGDMVGLVIAGKKPEQVVEICPRDFLMEYVGIGEQQENKVTLKERQYPCLVEKMTKMILKQNGNEIVNFDKDEFNLLRRTGVRHNTIQVHGMIDFGLIKHSAFKCKPFLDLFIEHIVEQDLVTKLFETPVMSMAGFFLDYGIKMDNLDMYLLEYAWFIGARTFAEEIIQRSLIKNENEIPSVSLLLAVHSGDIESVRSLLRNGTNVTGDAIYIAVHKHIGILETLLKHPGTDVNDRGNAVNGNYPLIIATRKGFTEAVKCLLAYGADPGVKNDSNMTALHKAIIYKRKYIIKALLDKGAPLDVRGGKFKRTPLHLAVDMDDTKLLKRLLRFESPVLVKDHRGHYPIHIAAIKGQWEMVKTLLPVDRRQENHRLSSYGKQSKIKGFSLYHIAVWKRDHNLLRVLLEMNVSPNVTDWYGQTALYSAIMDEQEEMVSMLLEDDHTDKKKAQKQGFTPLHAAIYKGLTDIALKLIPHSNINAKDRFGKTPIHCACEKVNTRVIERLLEHKADVRMITKRGDTIFHILRRQMKKSDVNALTAALLEKFFVKYDPDFVTKLPTLKNRADVTIRVRTMPIDRNEVCPTLSDFLRENTPRTGTNLGELAQMLSLLAHLQPHGASRIIEDDYDEYDFHDNDVDAFDLHDLLDVDDYGDDGDIYEPDMYDGGYDDFW